MRDDRDTDNAPFVLAVRPLFHRDDSAPALACSTSAEQALQLASPCPWTVKSMKEDFGTALPSRSA